MDNIYVDTNESLVLSKLFGKDKKASFDDILNKLEDRDDDADYLEIRLNEKDDLINDLRERLLKYE